MKTLYPDYCDRFRCLAGACPDSCCKEWEIVVDPDTAAFYRTVPGEIGERLRRHLATDAEGDAFFPLTEGRCPFWNDRGLCDIHAALGEGATSAVCRQFPYFVEEYEGFTERCPSLACPAAAELILSEPLTETVYPVPPASEDALLDLLAAGRAAALQTAAVCGTFAESAARIFAMAEDLQELYDGFGSSDVDYDLTAVMTDDAYLDGAEDFAQWLSALTERYLLFLRDEAEILTAEWRGLLETAAADSAPAGIAPREQGTAARVLRYLLYRYFLKPVNDEDILTWTAFILLGAAACGAVAARTGVPLSSVARLYAKEIEHDADNVERIVEFLRTGV